MFRRQTQFAYPQQPTLRARAGKAVLRAGYRGTVRAVRTGYRHRSRLWPMHGVLGMVAVAEGLGYVADGWKTTLVLCVVAGAVLGWSQARAARLAERWMTRSIVVAWAWWTIASAWTTTATAVGAFTVPMPGLLAVGGGAAQIWWLIHRHIRHTRHVVETAIEERAERSVDERADRWQSLIATSEGALPGSYLEGVTDLPDGLGWEANIQLPEKDAQNSQSAVAATRRIAKVYGVPATQVVVEPPVDGLEDAARLLVLTRNPLRDVQTFTAPALDKATGNIPIGIHADGSRALWRLYTPRSGANHGLIAGTTGAGKSGLLNVLCTEIRHSGLAILALADPMGGESVPDWCDSGAHMFAGTIPRIRRMLQGVEREMHRRQHARAKERWTDERGRTRRGRGYFDPTPAEPLITVVVDEAPDVVADPECRRIIAQIGKKGRKVGIGIILVVQVPSLSELGGDLTIRSMLSSTNIVTFRTSDRLSAQMGVPMQLPIDPASLPVEFPDGSTTAGLGFLAKAGGRVSPMRGMYVEDPYEWATSGEPAEVTAETAASWTDEKGNFFRDWLSLLDVDDDDDEPVGGQVAGVYAVQVPTGTRERIISLLGQRGEPMRLGVIATHVDVSKPAASMALKRLLAEGTVTTPRHGMWALVEQVAERELAGVG